jgi:hypothetical protein
VVGIIDLYNFARLNEDELAAVKDLYLVAALADYQSLRLAFSILEHDALAYPDVDTFDRGDNQRRAMIIVADVLGVFLIYTATEMKTVATTLDVNEINLTHCSPLLAKSHDPQLTNPND